MRRTLLLTAWLLTDIVLFVGAYVCAYFLRVGFILSSDFPLDRYVQAVLVISPIWVAVMIGLGIFRLTRVQSDKRNILHILFACVMGLSLFTLGYYFLFGQFFSRLLLVYAGALSFVLTTIWHLAFDQWQRRILRKDPPAYPVLIVGANREAERFIRLLNDRLSPLRPVGVLDSLGSQQKEISGVPVLGKLNVLESVIKTKRPTHLIQCSNLEHTINLVSAARQHNMTYMMLPSVLGIAQKQSMDSIEGQAMITVG
ncbi:hypothetical protein EXS65_04385 [Candidatus Peribacteria bacterium]|nr:hypothetical protein [Candidatus Peribacteria bacterium]